MIAFLNWLPAVVLVIVNIWWWGSIIKARQEDGVSK